MKRGIPKYPLIEAELQILGWFECYNFVPTSPEQIMTLALEALAENPRTDKELSDATEEAVWAITPDDDEGGKEEVQED